MFQVGKVIISDDVAEAKFQCNLTLCKGGCCVVGVSGAPVEKNEVPLLEQAWREVEAELSTAARATVRAKGLVQKDKKGNLELTCVGTQECVFVVKKGEIALCGIQKAFFEGRLQWEKPISCHLFPIRIFSDGENDFMNFVYVPELCSSGKSCGEKEGIYLSDFLERPLVRKYGENWYRQFNEACKLIRSVSGEHD
jgi:hypothetical protein